MPAAWERMNAPRRRRPSRRGVDAVGSQDAAHRAGRDPTTQARQLALDSLVAPPRVLPGEAHDGDLDVVGDGRPALRRSRVCPSPTDHPAVPGDQRVGRDHERRPPRPREDPTEQRQPRAVLRLEPRARLLTTKDVELVAQHEDLDLVRLPPAEAEHRELDDAAEREVDERPRHGISKTPVGRREAATLSTESSTMIVLVSQTDRLLTPDKPGRRSGVRLAPDRQLGRARVELLDRLVEVVASFLEAPRRRSAAQELSEGVLRHCSLLSHEELFN